MPGCRVHSKAKRISYLAGILLTLALPACAQIESATFTGMVVDPSGASIPHAVVTITNQATNVLSTFVTVGFSGPLSSEI